jgi:N-acetylmuramoyl-L-alanine amidase
MRNFLRLFAFFAVATLSSLSLVAASRVTPRGLSLEGRPNSAAWRATSLAQDPQESEPAPPQGPAPPQAPPAAPSGPLIVLDPAHGGPDAGARSEGSVVEKDVALRMARGARAELEREGYRVLMTRNDDSDPSYDDRAAVANAYREAIFVTLHVSSTGAPNTVRAYFALFSAPISPNLSGTDAIVKNPTLSPGALTPWEEAQRPFLDASRRLADLVQRELAKFFPGSPAVSSSAPVRGLRSIAAPGIAIEISSVSVSDPNSLTAAAIPIATAIGRGVVTFRQADSMGAK